MRATKEDSHKQEELQGLANRLYEQYGKPLEREHLGKFAAISQDGRTMLGDSPSQVGRQAKDAFGPGNFVFKLGPRVVGKWR